VAKSPSVMKDALDGHTPISETIHNEKELTQVPETEEGLNNKEEKAKSDLLDATLVLEKGMVHSNIKELKKKLNHLGFGKLKITKKFGTFAEKKVKNFQRYYDLEITGKADIPTLEKINQILDAPFQLNRHHENIIQLKQKLNWIGYGNLRVSSKFGPATERRIKDFQKFYKLPISGIADAKTCAKIDEVFLKIYSLGGKHVKIVEFKRNLIRAGFRGIEVTKKFGTFTERKVKEFQEIYDLEVTGTANVETMNKLEEILNSPLQVEKRHEDVILLKKKLAVLGYGGIKLTSKFGGAMEKRVKKFQKDYSLPESGIADSKTLEVIDKAFQCRELVVYNEYDLPLDEAIDFQLENNLHPFEKKEEVETYINPQNLVNDEKQKFLFLNLAKPDVVEETNLNQYLMKKGVFKGQGDQFKKAGVEHRINEVYLVIRALMATEDGTTELATGIPVDKNGHVTYMDTIENGEKQKIPSYTNQTAGLVFNMYGIHDGMEFSLHQCAKKAWEENWTTPEKAIVDGAKYVRNQWIGYDHDTFYKMIWHPRHMAEKREIKKQLAMDKEWILNQIHTLHQLYKKLGTYDLYLDIPVYKNQEKIDIRSAN